MAGWLGRGLEQTCAILTCAPAVCELRIGTCATITETMHCLQLSTTSTWRLLLPGGCSCRAKVSERKWRVYKEPFPNDCLDKSTAPDRITTETIQLTLTMAPVTRSRAKAADSVESVNSSMVDEKVMSKTASKKAMEFKKPLTEIKVSCKHPPIQHPI